MPELKASNRLLHEKSPYLLQHAYNPVDWFPWGEEAFAKAKAENKPVFLSIGYSTCHWCHVMAHESFEDQEVASMLFAYFIAVKVDREERPDIDAVYMNVCQAMTGSGGWPLTIIMTPEKKPFFAGTYLPKKDHYGRSGLLRVLAAVAAQWDSDAASLIASSEKITQIVSAQPDAEAVSLPEERIITQAYEQLCALFDERWGGFGPAPKFPMPHILIFLLRYHHVHRDPHALAMAESTLSHMYQGGLFDHIGFGFSRYSTDRYWLAPHFEKMLYDNALLVIALLECAQATQSTHLRDIAEAVLEYIHREMTAPDGGFYSAQDADSEGTEGKFYTFSPGEVLRVLGPADGTAFCRRYDITETGNFEGLNIPNLIKSTADAIAAPPSSDAAREALYQYRKTRYALHTDDKILTSWNALMIVAYSKAFLVTDQTRYLDEAIRAMACIDRVLMDDNGLHISYRDGAVRGQALLDDYAFLMWASLSLYDATFDVVYLQRAAALARDVIARFSDPQGGFFLSHAATDDLIFTPKETYDGALPSGNSVFAFCLVRLAALTGEETWRSAAQAQASFLTRSLTPHLSGHAFALLSLLPSVSAGQELVCVLRDPSEISALRQALSARFLPHLCVLVKHEGNAQALSEVASFTENYTLPAEKSAAFYLCEGASCQPPVFSLKDLLRLIDRPAK